MRSASSVKPAAVRWGPQSAPRYGISLACFSARAAWQRSSSPGRPRPGSSGRKRGQASISATASRPPGWSAAKTSARTPVGVGQVVHRAGRPDQVHGPDARPPRVQVGLDGLDPVGHAQLAGLDLQALQHGRGHVHGDGLRRPEVPEQGEGAGPGPGPQIGDPAGMAGRQPADPADHVGQAGVQHLGVEVQELGHLLVAVPAPGVVVARVMVIAVMSGHGPTVRGSCVIDIGSCL